MLLTNGPGRALASSDVGRGFVFLKDNPVATLACYVSNTILLHEFLP